MRTKLVVWTIALFVTVGAAGCSSLPSMPWSGSALPPNPTAEALFEEGVRNFNEKRYVRAIDNFTKIRAEHPFAPFLTEVELKIADAYYRNQQYPEAINAFKEFQAMHPANEHIAFVLLRLGQSYFAQFTATDREQKNTEVAKGYFETVITNHPKSPEAAEAKAKLVKCLEYLAEHEFNIAHFYFREEKYPAARDRFEEIVRKYKDTPTAVKSLFYLGESYRNEKNAIKATLAYEALIQHYPESKFAVEAKNQLARVENERHDPLALLLMRDRRPYVAAAPEVKPDPSLAKLRDLNLVAKTEVVHENPGDEKGFFRRLGDKLNPFSSSDNGKEEQKSETTVEQLAKRNRNQQSGGFFSSLWSSNEAKTAAPDSKSDGKALVSNIDEALKQKGIDSAKREAALIPPKADLPNLDDLAKSAPEKTDPALLSSIDANLTKRGRNVDELPPPPEAAEGFKDATAIQAQLEQQKKNESAPPPDVQSSGILSAIDQKLQAKGVGSAQFEKPPAPQEANTAPAPKPQPQALEIEPKLTLEKGPLYLNPAEVPHEAPEAGTDTTQPEKPGRSNEPPARVLVKGPVPPNAVSTKPAATNKPSSVEQDTPKGAFDQLRQDMEGVGKVLNPLSW